VVSIKYRLERIDGEDFSEPRLIVRLLDFFASQACETRIARLCVANLVHAALAVRVALVADTQQFQPAGLRSRRLSIGSRLSIAGREALRQSDFGPFLDLVGSDAQQDFLMEQREDRFRPAA
jgi:hypothetical protein